MNKYLYLMSSNVSKEYMADILEVFSSPKGCAHHYRYQLKYLDEELRNDLKHKGERINKKLKNTRVVICFLYQVNIGTDEEITMKWDTVYPIRMGKLKEAYKTGDSDRDIAHIYFEVDNHLVYDDDNFTEIIHESLKDKYEKCYAAFGNALENRYIADINENKQAFHKTCESLDLEHFQIPFGEKEKYYPIFTIIEGLRQGNSLQEPKYDKQTHMSYYEISEGSRYVFSFNTYFRKQPPDFKVKLISNKDIFATPEQYALSVSSRYDEESWSLVSRVLNQDTWANIKFESDLGSYEGKKPLNISVNFPVFIKRIMRFRLIEIISDVSYASGIIIIAVSRILTDWDTWYVPLLFVFPAWVITKGLTRWWRG